MLLSDWYAKWKEKRIQTAAKEAREEGYAEGYAAGKSDTSNPKGSLHVRQQNVDVDSRAGKSRKEKENNP